MCEAKIFLGLAFLCLCSPNLSHIPFNIKLKLRSMVKSFVEKTKKKNKFFKKFRKKTRVVLIRVINIYHRKNGVVNFNFTK